MMSSCDQPAQIEALWGAWNRSTRKRFKTPELAWTRLKVIWSAQKRGAFKRFEAFLMALKCFEAIASALNIQICYYFSTHVLAAYCSKKLFSLKISTNSQQENNYDIIIFQHPDRSNFIHIRFDKCEKWYCLGRGRSQSVSVFLWFHKPTKILQKKRTWF